ncbi:MAG: hypothetical protein M1822_001622 [Bathelium mastoideum]|nr:MAG: hypothetical protein M1822_001622 [Bathelium mastoideum]
MAGGDGDSSRATSRLNQLSSHLSSSSRNPNDNGPELPNSKGRTPKRQHDLLPADYSDVLAELSKLRSIAATPNASNRGFVAQKKAGKLWVRERLNLLLDESSFYELGSTTGTATFIQTGPRTENVESFVPSNNIQGLGTVTVNDGNGSRTKRKIIVTADDFSIRAGHLDGASPEKSILAEKMALAMRLPMVKLVDGSSGGGSVTLIRKQGYSYVPTVRAFHYVVPQLNQGIPNLGAVLGPAVGLGAARVTACHFSVMAADVGSLFNAGPKVVEGATFEEGLDVKALGGPEMHCTNGTIDNLASNEEACMQQIKTVLSFLPDHGGLAPPCVECKDSMDREDARLRTIIPRRQNRMYNPRTIIETVVDQGSWFEIGALWGTTAIGGLARLGGRPVGIISLNCEVNGGAIDAAGSQKITRLLKFCDVFNLPIIQFLDIPGYAIGTIAERSATMRWGIELAKTYYTTTTPVFAVITRRIYGVAGGVMVDCRDPMPRVAWPSGNWGSLPLDGGIEVGHRHELREAEKVEVGGAKEMYRALEDEYLRLMNPVRTAVKFGVEEIIDPKDTRKLICQWVSHVYGTLMAIRLAERTTGKIRPSFT